MTTALARACLRLCHMESLSLSLDLPATSMVMISILNHLNAVEILIALATFGLFGVVLPVFRRPLNRFIFEEFCFYHSQVLLQLNEKGALGFRGLMQSERK